MKRKNEQTNPEEQSVKTEEEQFAEFESEFNENNSAEEPLELVNPEDKKERKKRKKYISAVAAFVLILGVGVVGNWYYQNTDVSSTIQPIIDSATEKTLGKAELVDATTTDVSEENTYFTKARMERNTARDTALEKLQTVISNTSETEAARTAAAENIARISNFITIENKIETLVCAKGINNCIAVIKDDGSGVDIVVDCETLDDTTILQIKDIAMSQLQCGFEDVSIIQSNNK